MALNHLGEHQNRLERWAEGLLRPYIGRLKRHERPYETMKEFNDPVWGTLQLRPYEVVVLDSPLLQRLRRIRQLGVVHFVYPAATHTRLEHSLGVLHQVQRLVASINDHGLPQTEDGRRDKPLAAQHETTLRLAALCHDVGHGAMSHVSEYSIEEIRECEDIRLEFQKKHERPSFNQLSEIAAYYLIGSPAFDELLKEAFRLCPEPEVATDLPKKLQNIIIGKSINSDVLLLHELISGPFDADKLDYLARDALMCGVPNVADVARLIQKVRAVRVERSGLPAKLKRNAQIRNDGYLITGIARSGARTLDEVALARTLMFDKIYRHQKVRATEAMVFSLINELKKIYPGHPSMLPFALSDDEMLGLTMQSIEELAGKPSKSFSGEQMSAANAVCYIAQRLRDRRLFTRGFAFAANMPRDEYRHDPTHKEGLQRFIAECSKPESRAKIAEGIAQNMREICDKLGIAEVLQVAGGNITSFLWISPPKAPPEIANVETGHAYLIDENGGLLQAEEGTSEVSSWSDSVIATSDLGYIFSLRRLAPIVYIAAEAYVRRNYEVRIPETMLAYAKQNWKTVENHKRNLEVAGWYDETSFDIRPMPYILQRADAQDRVEQIVEKLSGYAGPWESPKTGGSAPTSTVSRQQVLAYVRQFGDDELVDSALTMLSHVMVIGRGDANQALTAFLDKSPEFKTASYCALGEYRDSSALLTYYVGDVTQRQGLMQRSLTDAVTFESPIVFVDDLIGRGSQSISIIENWLGVAPTEDLKERRTATLNEEQIRLFRSRKLAFVFIAGLDQGQERLRGRLAELGLEAEVYVHKGEKGLPFLSSVMLPGENLEKLSEFCRDRGERLLRDSTRSEEWVKEKALGYGNTGLLLASTYNTPSATLTCIWKGGSEGENWMPLLPRRKKT